MATWRKIGIAPGWKRGRRRCGPREKNFAPAHWRYERARGALDAAGRLINTELAERRNLTLINPASGDSYGTVRTMVSAYQMIMPGEWARAHRHTPNALRLILDAEPGAYTEVDGLVVVCAGGRGAVRRAFEVHANFITRARLLIRRVDHHAHEYDNRHRDDPTNMFRFFRHSSSDRPSDTFDTANGQVVPRWSAA